MDVQMLDRSQDAAKDVNRMALTRVNPHADMKRPVLASAEQNWLERWQSLNHESGRLS